MNNSEDFNTPTFTYLRVKIRVKPGKMKPFQEYLNRNFFFRKTEWQLISATRPFFEDHFLVEHLWLLPLGQETMSLSKAIEPADSEMDPEEFNHLVESETQEMIYGMEYDPRVYGYQHYTIFIDKSKNGCIVKNQKISDVHKSE